MAYKGTVKWFNTKNGYGFITPDEQQQNGKDIFVHKNGCTDTITEGDRVIFDLEEGKKGPQATNVERE